MSTMNETMADEAFFIPSDDEVSTSESTSKYPPSVVEGEYLGHIVDARNITREFAKDGNQVKATIFNFKVKVAKENTVNSYNVKGRTVDGAEYTDKHIMADGVFRFLEPKDGDAFVSNAEGNKRYLMFCQSLGMEIPTHERTINGKTVTVQSLPDVGVNDLNGTPVIAVVGKGKPWTDDTGTERPSWKVKFTKQWTDGEKITTINTDDLPF
tara:strand:- start:392 stop:1024 length:633 start_codon:yes stop_codon:yes gene_type:complete